jgi:hypothetical protein
MYSKESDNSILVQREILRVKIVTSATLKKKRTSSRPERQQKAVKKGCEDQVGDNGSMFTLTK